MRFNQSTGVVVVSLPPAIVLLLDGPAEPQRAVTEALAKAALKERHALVSREQALAMVPRLAGCLPTLGCRVELATQNEAPYVLAAQLAGGPPPGAAAGAWQLRLQLVDAAVGEVAAEATPACASCTAEQAAGALAAALGPLLTRAAGRPRGTVEITSDPPGAEVFIGGQRVGATPYRGSRYAGELAVEVRRPGLPPYQTTVAVRAGEKASVSPPREVAEAEPPPAQPDRPATLGAAPERYELKQQPRPIWRLATGGVLLGAGLLAAGFGASALSVDGSCDLEADPLSPCTRLYSTGTIGISLIATGAALAVVGAVLVALPGPKRPVRLAAVPVVLPLGGGGLLGAAGRF